jgi:beta-lactamase regulating signal transducer with metallopeptidase domain
MDMPLWFANLVFWSVQVALLVLAAGLLTGALKLRQPRVLFAYWRSLLATSLLLPFMQPWHRPHHGAPMVISTDVVGALLPAPSSPAASHGHLPSLQTIAPILGIVILVGIALRCAILALGLLKLHRLRQASRPIASAAESAAVLQAMATLVAAPAEFRLSAQVDSPVTFGFVAPVVLLPERFASLDPRFQSAIACHELLHVRRRDWVHHLGEEILRAVFWFHPAIAWLVSRVRLAREQIVDLEVVRLTEARKPYLESLLEFANGPAPIAAIPAPPFLAERQLVERIALMLEELRMSRRRLIASLAAISCCLILIISLAAWTFPLQGAPRPAPSTLGGVWQQNLDRAVPLLRRIEVKHHDFTGNVLSDTVVNDERTRLNQLPGRLTVETAYDQAKAGKMKEALESFWSERGITVEVRTTLTPYARSARYANLQFDVYEQTILPGRLEGGTAGGVAGGISQGISHGIAEGVSRGIVGGIRGALRTQPSSDEPSVDYSTIWLDTVKRGPMMRQVRGSGTLVRGEGSANLVARVSVPASLAADVKPGQSVAVGTKKGPLANGHVHSTGAPSSNDTRTVDIALDALPPGTSAGLEVIATINIEKLDNALFVGRPVGGSPNTGMFLFKIINNGSEAIRTYVKLGRASATTIEVLDGLKEGDQVILSDVSSVGEAERIRITDDQHVLKH